jgi:RHS repeat-associated protein
MKSAIVNASTTNYVYNALGQLIEKSGNGGTTLLMYDEAGHILGEYSSTGALIEETIWMGDTPVATLLPNGSSITIYYIHTDHLGTPRKITRTTDNGLMWRWDPDTFGSMAPNTNPAGLGTFTYNLRYPGQYYLAESGLMYNYFRDYDPQTGRYLESDPIGLDGGSYSTYVYAASNPVMFIDPSGLMCVYSQLTGNLRCVDDTTGQEYLNCSAYSGKGIGLNNPDLQYLSGDLPKGLTIPGFVRPSDAGSIPRGGYIIGYPIRRPHKAAPVLPLFPTPDNSALGRTELQIHGDNNSLNHSASDGCIIAKEKCRVKIHPGEYLQVTW